jgi:CubicO group peptidase (beta-lactamase class C family)
MWLAALALAASASWWSSYAEEVEKARADWGVPGVAVGVAQGDRVVLLRGFGVRESGKSDPVGPNTVFPIASLSKGFTTTAIGTLVERGELRWDDRVAELLPGFAIADPWVSRETTLRDLLGHRTGWQAEVEWLWVAHDLPRSEILSRLAHARPSEGFRAGYDYLNVPYLVAGEAAARRAGSAWETLLRERVLAPLGLKRTFATLAETTGIEDRATAHTDADGSMRPRAHESGDAVAPAAGMFASVADLLRWLRFQSGAGALEGVRLYGEEVAREIHAVQNSIPIGSFFRRQFPESHFQAYGLGWVLQDYRGRKVIWNTGGMVGSACSIAIVPEEGLAVAVVSNGPRTGFPEALVWRAIDTALGAPAKDWSALKLEISKGARTRAAAAREAQEKARIPNAPASLPVARYAGSYRDRLAGDVEVREEAGRLRVRFGTAAGMAEPWHHETFRVTWDDAVWGTSLVTFQSGPDGAPARLVLEDAGAFERVP